MLQNYNTKVKGSIAQFPWLSKVLILLGIFFLGEVVFSYLAIGLIQVVFPNIDFFAFLTNFGSLTSTTQIQAQEIAALKLYQLISSIGRFIIGPLFYIYLCGESYLQALSLKKEISGISILFIFFIMLASTGVIGFVNDWNKAIELPNFLGNIEQNMRRLEDQAQLQTEAFLATTSIAGLFLNIVIIGVVAAIGEEILFRGILQNIFVQWSGNSHVGVWIAAFIFSFIHLQFFGFFPRLLLGALLGYLYLWSGSLWSAIVAHFINNTTAVIAFFLVNKNLINQNVTEDATWQYALYSLPIIVILIYYYRRYQLKQH